MDRLSAHDPVVTEVAKGNGLAAGFSIGHELRDIDLVTQDGIIGMIPFILVAIPMVIQLQKAEKGTA